MHFKFVTLTLFGATLFAGHAQAQTKFTIHRVDISGNKNVDATGINDHDEIVATVFDNANNTQSGVVLQNGTVTTLPLPYGNSGPPIPQAINGDGDVLGYTYVGYQPFMFLYRAGQYDQAANIALEIEQQAGPPPLPIGMNAHDEVFFTVPTGMQDTTDPSYGKLTSIRSMPVLMRYQTARSINRKGTISGTAFYGASSEVFVGKDKRKFSILLPPGAVSAKGGFVNDKGQVAGTYTDGSDVQHGFVWQNGTYISFELPEQAQPYSMAVTGFNDGGRVVGTYTSASTSVTHAFLYNGSSVTALGNYNRADVIGVVINNRGTMLLSDQVKNNPTDYRSYRVTCSGSSC